MKVLIDLNVLMDVFERRHPHYDAAAKIISLAIGGRIDAAIPGHAPTTIHYLARKFLGPRETSQLIDWILANFEVAPATREIYQLAQKLDFRDFEDAVVGAMALAGGYDWIVTRNLKDFSSSHVAAVTPADLLARH